MRGNPGRTATYRLYDSADRLLYVGVGELPTVRWQNHKHAKDWWSEVVRAVVVWHPTRDEAFADETRAIESENPLHNVMGTSRMCEVLGQSQRAVARMTTPLSGILVGSAEIGAALGVSSSRVQQIVRKPTFPAPCGTRARGRLWRREDVAEWITERRPPSPTDD